MPQSVTAIALAWVSVPVVALGQWLSPTPVPTQPSPSPESAASTRSTEEPAEAPGRTKQMDPGDDRVLVGSSTWTLPEGMVSFTDYEVMLGHFSYGVADNLQVSLGFTFPVMQVAVIPSVKWRFFESDIVRLAGLVDAGLMYWFAGLDVTVYGGGGGLLADVCLGQRCSSFLSFGATVQAMGADIAETELSGGVTAVNGNFHGGVGGRLSRVVKALFEWRVTMFAVPEESSRVFTGWSLGYGIRIYGKRFGVDVGFLRPFLAMVEDEAHSVEPVMKYLPLGYPWLAFTYQW